jgi:hypothetical protein
MPQPPHKFCPSCGNTILVLWSMVAPIEILNVSAQLMPNEYRHLLTELKHNKQEHMFPNMMILRSINGITRVYPKVSGLSRYRNKQQQ